MHTHTNSMWASEARPIDTYIRKIITAVVFYIFSIDTYRINLRRNFFYFKSRII